MWITIHTIAMTAVHALTVVWQSMTLAYAGLLSEMKSPATADTNKQQGNMKDNMTLASKVEVEHLSYNMTRKDRDEKSKGA